MKNSYRNILIVIVLLFVSVGIASADSWLPDNVEHWSDECGYTCYVFPDGSGECYPCLQCEVTYETATPSTPVTPVDTPTPPPPQPTDTPAPPDGKVKCNAGGGNGSEGDPDCDPGNSGENNNAGD